MKKLIVVIAVAAFALTATAQTTVKFKINHLLEDQAFAFNQKASNNLDNEFNVKRLEYYISAMSLTHDGGKITKADDVYILVDGGSSVDLELGKFDITTLESINFSIGVDPGVNNQDPTQWPSNHALAPKSPSMHWGWSSGYRFVAIEGKTGSSLNTTFEIHALGNENFFKVSIPTKGSMDNGSLVVELDADYTEALANIDISSGLVIHGTTDQAVRLLRNFANTVFSSEEGNVNTLSIKEAKPLITTSVYPNPSTGKFIVQLHDKLAGEAEVSILNITGQTILQQKLSEGINTVSIANKGVFLITVRLNGVTVETKRILLI
ncbi:MAG: T9SS type A sorting domain-containing protein [Bacteroidetes bacterium]|jgi:hypothetical protein|nr:T9SS type A sorting domain-containing protein [Bacteroidota bacterium]